MNDARNIKIELPDIDEAKLRESVEAQLDVALY